MNKTTTFRTLGIAILLVLAMSLAATGGAAELRTDLGVAASGHGCDLTLPGDTCAGAAGWLYDLQSPIFDRSATLAAAGSFTSRIAELPPFQDFWIQVECVSVAAGYENVVGECFQSTNHGGPKWGWPVQITGESNGVAVPSLTATAS